MTDAHDIRAALEPLLQHDLLHWRGLADLSFGALQASLGQPAKTESAILLGRYPAERYTFELATPSCGVAAYVRHEHVVAVETIEPPPLGAVTSLPEEPIILPHEILVEGTYVHEHLYRERGLLVSVAEPFDKERPRYVARCRGIRPLAANEQPGPELYLAFEDRIVWQNGGEPC